MPNFRCYALDGRGRIVVGEYIEADTLASAIDLGWQFVASVPAADQANGLEIWQGGARLFSTAPNIFAHKPAGDISITSQYIEQQRPPE